MRMLTSQSGPWAGARKDMVVKLVLFLEYAL